MESGDYRKRVYDEYVSNIWRYSEDISEKSRNLACRFFKKRFKKLLPVDKDARILDVGAGIGHFLYFLKGEGYANAVGIDIGKEQVELARKMGMTNVETADMFEYLAKRGNEFDMIVASQVFEHLTKNEILKALDLFYKALRPGGKAFIITPNATMMVGQWLALADFTHETVLTPQSLAHALRVCRFDGAEIIAYLPVAYDFRSGVRTVLWRIMRVFINLFYIISHGTGRDVWKQDMVFEPIMLGIGTKK